MDPRYSACPIGPASAGWQVRDCLDCGRTRSLRKIWEIAIKRRLKKLEFGGSAVAAIGANGFHELPILPMNAENAGALLWRHGDPFDRMLIVQAKRLAFTLATADTVIRGYPHVAQLWAG